MIPTGTTLNVWNEQFSVGAMLGEGGEGQVYAVHNGSGDPVYALKWYFEHTAVEQRRHTLVDLVERGSPHTRFLWPLGLIDPSAGRDEQSPNFGYLMHIRPPTYVSVAKLLALEVPRHEDRVVQLAFEVAHSFLALHALGLCYRDISFGNVFLDPNTGHALICDNDNAGIDGASKALVRGTPKFMAPEIVRGEAVPSKRTDHYSLAILLFYLLFVGHPLEGERTENVLADRAAHFRFYGYDPIFCLDPDNETNRPVPGLHDHVTLLWDNVPAFVRALFIRCFTAGLADPKSRVSDSEWCDAMMRLRDSMYTCPSCEAMRYLGSAGSPEPCPHCRTDAMPDMVVTLDHHRLVVSPLLRITAHHVLHNFDSDTSIAVAERHPADPGVIGLRNNTTETWGFRTPDGREGEVPPSQRVRATPGMMVEMGSHRARIEALRSK